MPMRPITVKANFQLDTSAARAQLQGLQKELSSITKGATMDLGITPQITQAIKEAQQLKSILAEATDFSTGVFDLSKFDAAMKQYGKGINELKQNLQTLGPDGEKAFNSLATTIASAQVPLKRTSQGVKDFVTAFGNTMRWQATSMAMHKMVGTIQQAFNYAQSLDKSLTNIQIVTGHNANYMRNFAIEANKAAQALSASTLEYTNASLIYYQQGLGDKEVAKRAETTLKLAKVTGESASKVSQQMTAVWNNFSNGVDNLERYADVMTALGATTASSSSEIAKGLEKFASVTKTIGLSYDYAASALATVTAQTRQSADTVGTSFKTLFSRLESLNLGETLDDATTLNKYSEALLKAGVNVMDVNGHLKDMDTILDELGAQWNNLNKAQQVALAQTVGGVRNYTSLITLMDNWQDFQNNVVTSQLAEGTLQKQVDIYAQSWEAAQQRVKTASQGIYDTLISSDFFKGFNNALAGTLNLINGIGKGLGTSGSVAGIANLFLGLNGERVAKGIDNFTINTLGQTSFGQNVFRAQQKKILEDLTSNIYDTGVRSSQIRKDVYENLMGSWDEFRNKTYGSKAELQTNQLMMQQLTAQAQNVMNSAIDMDRLKLDSQITSRKAAEIFAGKFGMGQTSNVYTDLMRIFDNQSSDQGAYKAGFSEYLQDTFVTKLTKLASMDIDNSSSQAVQSLKGQIQAQAENAMKNTKIGDIIKAEGKDSPLYTAINTMVGGITRQKDIDDIIANLSMYNTDQIQAYEQMRQKLDQDFLKNNPDAVKKETYTVKAGGRTITKTRAMRDANGNLIMDENSAAAKEYLAQMSDQKQAAIAAQKAGYITEQQAQDVLSGNKNLRDILKPQQEMTTSFGNAAVSAGQMVSSMTMAISSLNNFRESIQNGTVTATGTMSMLGSLGLAAGQMVPVLTNTTKILGTGLSVAGLGGIAALATATIGATVYGVNVAKAQGLNAKTDYANESKIAAVAQAKEDQQKYDQFLPVIQQQQQALDKLTSLQEGTPEYTAQLIASNNAAREIIDTYGLKAGVNYDIGTNGVINFTAAQIKQTNDDLLKQLQESDFFSQAALSGFDQLSGIQERLNLQEKINDLLLGPNVNVNQEISQDQLEAAFKLAQEDNYRGAATFSSAEMWSIGQTREDAIKQLAEAGYLTNTDITANDEQILKLKKEYETQLTQSNLAAQADFQSVLNSALNTTNKTDELQLAAKALGLDNKALGEYQDFLKKEVYSTTGFLGLGNQSATRDSTGGLRSASDLRKLYEAEFGYKASADIVEDQQALATAIENHRVQTYLLEQLQKVGEQFKDTNILSDFLNINDKDYKSVKEILEKTNTISMSEDVQKVYNTFVQKTLTDSVKAQDNLVQAMMANTQFNGQEYIKIAQQLQEGAANFSTQQLETLTNYVNSFTNNFGEEAGKAVFDALTNNQQGWNQNYYEALQKISLDNSISALADLTQFNNQRINADLVEPLGKLRSAIIEDVESRGGLAKTLFTSSEFTKVFDSLSEQYKATGEITSQNIADLAKKNDIIGDYMTVSGANEQAIADLFEIVASGDLSVENITPAIEHFVQRASGAEGAQQEALDVAAEQDLSDSITNMDKWAQNIGKAWYTGRTHDVLGDRPVLEGLKMVLTPEDYAKYMRTLAVGAYGGTTSSMLDSMKGNMANAYAMLTELEGSGKKKGKGGGGMDTVYEYLAKSGIFDESGIQYDTNTHNFVIGGDKFADRYALGDNNRLVTFSGLKDYIIESLVGSKRTENKVLTGYGFEGQGYTREQAENLATMMLGSMSGSSMGTILSASGLIDAANTFFGELKGEGQEQGNYITPEQYNALFNQYSDILATMKMETDKNGNLILHEASIEEMQKEDFEGVTATEWREYFIQEAKKAGSAIIGIKGSTQLGKQDAKAIGEAIAGASQGTIKATQGKETDAIVQAAVAAGVQMYRDTWFEYGAVPGNARQKEVPIEQQGQSLDYDQLQNFYNNVLGLSTEILNTHLKDISKENGGLAFTHKWTDAYGVEHNVNFRDYGGNTDAFVRSIEQENNFSNAILEFQRDKWIFDYFNNDEIWTKYGDTANASGAMRYLDDMFRQAQQEAQTAANNTTQSNPAEGEDNTKPEGNEEEIPSEGEGTLNKPTGANGLTVEQQAEMNDSSKFVYQNEPLKEEIYKYWKEHGGTQAEAYDAVVLRGERVSEEAFPINQTVIDEEEDEAFREAGDAALAAARETYQKRRATAATAADIAQRRGEALTNQIKRDAARRASEENAARRDEEEAELQAELNRRQRIAQAAEDLDEQIIADYGTKKEQADAITRMQARRVAERNAQLRDEEEAELQAELDRREKQTLIDMSSSQLNALGNVNETWTPEQIHRLAQIRLQQEAQAALENEGGEEPDIDTEGTLDIISNRLTEVIDENLSAMGEAIPGSDAYEKAFAAASQYTPSDTAAEKTNDLLNDQLKQEKFIAENTQLTAESTTAQLDYLGEEEDATQTRKAIGQEERQILDEKGNLIELPQNQQPQSIGGNTSGQGDITAGGQTQGKEKTTIFSNGMVRNNTTGQYAMPDGSGGWTVVDSPDKIDWDGSQAQAKSQSQIPGMDGRSSGQNNTRLLAYASGKEGHIAVTGELGPELRVKSDGSMDILGKTGREYAWIEPDDRIYTASQSAGILKSNKIPGLEGLARGINNYIPGYYTVDESRRISIGTDKGGSGSGGGTSGHGSGSGASGEKDPRYDPNTLKIRDILERYYTILQQVDDITKAVEHIGKAIDRGWGQERIKNLERQEKLLESQYKMQEAYVKEIKDYLKVDKDALTTMVTDFVKEYNEGKNDTDKINLAGAIFDENGVLTNYKDIVDKLVSAYNKNAEANAQNKEEQYKFQERLKDIQMYTDTLNQLQEAEEKLYDLNNQILDTRIRQITYRIEYENEMDANDLKLVNFQYDQIADNAYRTAEAIDLTAQKSSYLADELHRYENGITEILGKYFDRDLTDKLVKMFYENPTQFAKEWQKIMETDPRYQDITDEHKNTLEGWMDRSIEIVKTLWDNYDKTIDKMSDDIKTFSKTLDGVLDKFDYFNSVYDSLNNIIGLTNRSLTNIDAAFMKTLSDRQLENSMNKFRGATREVQTMNKAVAETTLVYNAALAEQMNYTGDDQYTKDRLQDKVDNAKKALDIVIEQNENATKQFYDAWENCLKAIEERYKVAMQEVGRDYERSISPYFMTLELLQNQYDREKELADLYVKDYQRIHDLSKLNRDIQKSIDDTDNLKGKQRLRDLQKEINDLQENGNDLSEYDLNILQKKYDLELARQALEDAKDAKSLVRLTRDNNGNWSYVYTSNQDDVDEAEQNYEDKIRDMEQANEDYIREMQDQIVDLTAQARQALEGLNPADFASPEEFQEYLNNLIKYYQDRLDFATSQLNNAAGNNVALAPDIQRMYNNLDHNLTTNPGQTILSAMFGTQNFDDAIGNIMDGINNMAGEALKTYATIYSEMQKEVYEIAGVDIANAASGLGDIIDIIAKASAQQVDVMDKEATRIDDAYTDTINAIQAYQASLADLIGETNTMTNSLSSLNTFLHSSGEYVPTNTLYEKFQTAYKNVAGFSSGGYTGRWQYADTGMYTGEWPDGSSRRNGRLAWLHQKELVLNAHDTENFLDAMQIVRQLDNLTNWMANGLGDLMMPRVSSTEGELNQNVHIEAEFPNVTDHNEIEQAFGNLVNMASQYANRK